MSDSSDDQAGEGATADADVNAESEPRSADDAESAERSAETTEPEARSADDLDALRQQVDAEYDFEDFGPADMARMSADEWEAAFDADSWITGPRLLDRVEKEVKNRIARRQIFGVIERERIDGVDHLLVYSDEGYVTVGPDGNVEGEGGVLRDVEPVVALCSMDEYEVAEPPEEYQLPSPDAVPEQSGELGNLMVQVIAGMQLLGGLGLIGAWLVTDLDSLIAPVIGGLFVVVGVFLFSVVANARLSDRFRSEQYRRRLQAVETGGFDRPDLPGEADDETAAIDESQESRDRTTEGA